MLIFLHFLINNFFARGTRTFLRMDLPVLVGERGDSKCGRWEGFLKRVRYCVDFYVNVSAVVEYVSGTEIPVILKKNGKGTGDMFFYPGGTRNTGLPFGLFTINAEFDIAFKGHPYTKYVSNHMLMRVLLLSLPVVFEFVYIRHHSSLYVGKSFADGLVEYIERCVSTSEVTNEEAQNKKNALVSQASLLRSGRLRMFFEDLTFLYDTFPLAALPEDTVVSMFRKELFRDKSISDFMYFPQGRELSFMQRAAL